VGPVERPGSGVLVIVGLLLARAFGWLWMDPLAGIVGACVTVVAHELVALSWLCKVDRVPLSAWDMVGAAVVLLGMGIIVWGGWKA
jgi:drug/metabolite transporter superfamily protein YnfA